MSVLESIKTVFEILAYVSAVAFFAFKAYSGVAYISLSLALNVDKRKKIGEKDMLVLDLTITGGENAMLDLYQIQGRITYGDVGNEQVEEFIYFEGLDRVFFSNLTDRPNSWESDSKHKYRIGVKEQTSFTYKIEVPSNAVCRVDIVVVGTRRKFWRKIPTISQWRVSQISLPN